MNCWTVLGLEADADSRSIKRRYAALLKQHRPDEDPQGFQRLREAYEQALAWASHEAQEPPAVPPAHLHATPVTLPDGPPPAQRLAARLLEGISALTLDARLEQARSCYCAREFEDGLLQLCQLDASPMCDLAEQAVERFQWLTPWQREDLPRNATDPVLINLLRNAERQLDNALCHENPQGFLDLCRRLDQSAWLQTLDRRQWFNECLARLLLAADFWSNALFDAVCAQQGWKKTGNRTPCPEPYWQHLLARSHRVAFLEEQRRLAAQASDSTGSRAARLLFEPMSEDRRVRLTARFSAADWQACEALAGTVQQRYPGLALEMPDADLFFWRPLRRRPPRLPLPAAIVGVASVTAVEHYYQLGSSLLDTLIAMLALAGTLGILAWGLTCGCQALGYRAWRLDQHLSRAYGRWLSLRRGPLLPLRECLATWLLAGAAGWVGGVHGLLTYLAILCALALASRTPWSARLAAALKAYPYAWPREVLIGTVLGLTASMLWLTLTLVNYRPLGVNEGLQAWPERLCVARLSSASPCRVPATQQQWYGPVSRTEPSRDQ